MDIKTIIIIAAFLFFILLENIFSHFKKPSAKKIISHDLQNIFLGFMNGLMTRGFSILFFIPLFQFCEKNSIGIIYWLPISPLFQWIIALVLMDLWMYTWHFINHQFRFFWIFHRVHHSELYLNASSSIRFHTIEILYSSLMRIPVYMLIGMQLDIIVIYETILSITILFHHSNTGIPETIDLIIRVILVTPNMHRVHHSIIENETNSNYSTTISLWDRVFRTYVPPKKPKQIVLGLDRFRDSHDQSLLGMLRTPFITNKK